MSLSPSSPQEEPKPQSPLTAPREIPDSDPSSSVSSPAEASDPAPSGLTTREISKSNPTTSCASPSFHVDPTQGSIKPASQGLQDTELSLPPPSSSPQAIQDTELLLPPPTSSPPPPPPINPQEAKKIATLKSKITALETQINEIAGKQKEVDAKLKTKDPKGTVKAHIKLLHDYNEIRDVGQGLMGIIADNRGVRVIDVYEEFGVGEGD